MPRAVQSQGAPTERRGTAQLARRRGRGRARQSRIARHVAYNTFDNGNGKLKRLGQTRGRGWGYLGGPWLLSGLGRIGRAAGHCDCGRLHRPTLLGGPGGRKGGVAATLSSM